MRGFRHLIFRHLIVSDHLKNCAVALTLGLLPAISQAADVPLQPMTSWADVLALPAVCSAIDALSPDDKAAVDMGFR